MPGAGVAEETGCDTEGMTEGAPGWNGVPGAVVSSGFCELTGVVGGTDGFSVASGSAVFPGSVGDGETIGVEVPISSPPPSEVTVPAYDHPESDDKFKCKAGRSHHLPYLLLSHD